jgi:D-amino peptidase
MKFYIMTDLECVSGVVTLPEYCLPDPKNKYGRPEAGKYYERAKELAIMEVNAAVEGLLEAGVTEILVCDGHGPGGLDVSIIHPAARVLTGKRQKQPRGLDDSFDAAIIIGQHAKANTDGGHLAHSGSFSREDWLLNGESIGEIALLMATAGYFNVPVVMISGDVAACNEARELVSSIETVPVIEGQKMGSSKGMTTDQAIDLNVSALHVSPVKAREMIRDGAKRCVKKTETTKPLVIDPPYEMVRITRADKKTPSRRAVNRSADLIELMNQPVQYK